MGCGASILEGGQNPGGHPLSRSCHCVIMGCSLQGSNPWAPPTSSSTPPGTRSRSVRAGRAPTAATRGSSEPTAAPPGEAAVFLGGAEGRQAARSPRQHPINSTPLPSLATLRPSQSSAQPPALPGTFWGSPRSRAQLARDSSRRSAGLIPSPSALHGRAGSHGVPEHLGHQRPPWAAKTWMREIKPNAVIRPQSCSAVPFPRRLRARSVHCGEVGTNPHGAAATKGHAAATGAVRRPPGCARAVLGAAGQCHPTRARLRKRSHLSAALL